MIKDKSDYKKGLLYFCYLMLCVCLFFTTPDGDIIFYKILGLFGINPGIKLGNSTLYIYMLIPIILAVKNIKNILKYWWSYGSRFKEYSFLLRYLPIFIALPIFLLSSNILSPSGIDLIYYSVIGQRNGLKAITYTSDEILNYNFVGDITTYSYNLTLENHGNETLEFNVKLAPYGHNVFQEVFIKDDDGEKKVFTLLPKEKTNYSGEFKEYQKRTYSSGSGNGIFLVYLINNNEIYNPKPIIR